MISSPAPCVSLEVHRVGSGKVAFTVTLGPGGVWEAAPGGVAPGPQPPSLPPFCVPGQPSAGTLSMRCWRHGRRRSPPREDTESAAAGPAWRPALGPRRPRPSARDWLQLSLLLRWRSAGGECWGRGPRASPRRGQPSARPRAPGVPTPQAPRRRSGAAVSPGSFPREEAFTPHRKHMPMRRHTSGWCGREATCYKDIFLVFKKT